MNMFKLCLNLGIKGRHSHRWVLSILAYFPVTGSSSSLSFLHLIFLGDPKRKYFSEVFLESYLSKGIYERINTAIRIAKTHSKRLKWNIKHYKARWTTAEVKVAPILPHVQALNWSPTNSKQQHNNGDHASCLTLLSYGALMCSCTFRTGWCLTPHNHENFRVAQRNNGQRDNIHANKWKECVVFFNIPDAFDIKWTLIVLVCLENSHWWMHHKWDCQYKKKTTVLLIKPLQQTLCNNCIICMLRYASFLKWNQGIKVYTLLLWHYYAYTPGVHND